MNSKINLNVQNMQISGIRQFFNRIQHIEGMISLTIGQPDFETPLHIKSAAIRAIEENHTSYTHNAGYIELRQAISTYMNKKYKLDYTPDSEIIVTNGASQAIDTALRTILSPGDEVILPSPVYPGYTPIINQCGGSPVFIDTTTENFKLSASLIEKSITGKTKCIVLPYPSNPTGVSLTGEELEEIAGVASEHDLLIIADEIYSELTYGRDHFSIGTIAKDRTIVINGLSKSHSMTGWRIGVLMAPAWLASQCLKVHQYNVSCASSISQMAALEAFTAGIDDAIPMREAYKKRKELTSSYLRKLGFKTIEPDGAFYFLAGIPIEIASFDFAVELAEKAGVGVIPGTAFDPNGEGYVRISYACSEDQIHEAFKRIERYLSESD
ncbi:aminotransferase class I/II-fold pyridoxal phosphate-dependent enzyme [Jeotgalibacillus proteolyticus]|uniref:Aminotransferase n=1 Tax=Jeotgalibacillus proteolyticus TaxID=2082395 RepID=A0A2S5GGX1_9BACL|nr:aminotransferase class I/II-fold pyridoxal phosphate-dependent enzyme [Jeotgalibacillus proteolyticus]PPA72226.1 aromatic amino acid aminotransferase [Jeotgalibacillus proteolyticus]